MILEIARGTSNGILGPLKASVWRPRLCKNRILQGLGTGLGLGSLLRTPPAKVDPGCCKMAGEGGDF